jgi:PAS domain S-box-containing protein
MSKHIDRPEYPAPLRHQAEVRIREGSSPHATHQWSTGVEALTLLHRLASTPESAGDALKLLHELQVHQVELDLQYEQMELSQSELAEELHRYTDIYRFAPVAYVMVNKEGKITHANLAAAELFGVPQDDLDGKQVSSLLTLESRQTLSALWKRLHRSGSRETCEVQVESSERGLRTLLAIASAAPDGQSFLLALMDQPRS